MMLGVVVQVFNPRTQEAKSGQISMSLKIAWSTQWVPSQTGATKWESFKKENWCIFWGGDKKI